MSSRQRASTIAIDVAVVLAVFFVEVGPVIASAPPWHVKAATTLDIVRLIGFSVPLLWRRRFPIAVLAVVVASFAGSDLLGLGLVAAFFSVGAYARHEWASRAASAAGAIAVTAALVVARNLGLPFEAVIPVAVFGGAWFLGQTMRLRRTYTQALEERAARLEAERDESERRAAADERARIARDLHDIVAHRVSMMTVQAGAARVVAEKDPEAARRTIALLEEAGRQTLWELRRLVSVLRDDVSDGDGAAPRPGFAQLERLVRDVEASGTPVTLDVSGDTSTVPEAVQVSAYRIVQEALTNVVKHAGSGAEATVVLRSTPDVVEIEVTDTGTGSVPGAFPGGHGIVGMRERVAVFGGTVTAGPRDAGGFAVSATLPVVGRR